jgi:hypothetical protein
MVAISTSVRAVNLALAGTVGVGRTGVRGVGQPDHRDLEVRVGLAVFDDVRVVADVAE